MNVLFLSPSDMTTEPVITSLVGHRVVIHRYDREGLPVDRAMLDAADRERPDIILYIGQNNAPFMAETETFLRLKQRAPTVLICHDASDKTWIPVLNEYQARDAFSLIVNIDGSDDWPRRPQDFTALTPIPPQLYENLPPLLERPIAVGFAGGYASASRRAIIEHLIDHAGLVVPQRNEAYGSYGGYARFMKQCQIVVNVPWSGSEQPQVKGRVLEAGMAGCVLLEHIDSAASRWFSAGLDYAVYTDRQHAMEVIAALRKDPEQMQSLAQALHRRVTGRFSAAKFWNRIFKGLGV